MANGAPQPSLLEQQFAGGLPTNMDMAAVGPAASVPAGMGAKMVRKGYSGTGRDWLNDPEQVATEIESFLKRAVTVESKAEMDSPNFIPLSSFPQAFQNAVERSEGGDKILGWNLDATYMRSAKQQQLANQLLTIGHAEKQALKQEQQIKRAQNDMQMEAALEQRMNAPQGGQGAPAIPPRPMPPGPPPAAPGPVAGQPSPLASIGQQTAQGEAATDSKLMQIAQMQRRGM